jgi:hypothetical protein
MDRVLRNTGQIARDRGSWWIAVIIGVLACLLVTGGLMLYPSNIRWLTQSDLAQSYLGWAFFRDGPWSWPPGADPLYGAGLHASVYYSDSIPLLALLFKLFAAWLPTSFQYFGLWVLACFVLQAFFAWRLLELVTSSRLVKALATVFFVFAPPMLLRLGGHMALVGHWIVLAAIYLCLRRTTQRHVLYWTALLVVAIAVHAYLFAVAAAIWLADLAQRYWIAPDNNADGLLSGARRCLPEVLSVGVAVLLAAWLSGFFMISGQGMHAEGFGYYKMNVLAPINGAGWSRLGLNVPEAPGEYEGFNYLGLGAIALIASALLMRAFRRGVAHPSLVPRPLWAMMVVLVALAITTHVGIGTWQWQIPMPQKWWTALSHIPLQSTGRLFWAVYYLVLLAALFVLLQTLSRRQQIAVLSCAVLLQCVDLYPRLANMHAYLLARSRDTVVPGLHGAFWDVAGTRYKTLRMLPLTLRPDGWERLAFYANSQRMGTDIVQVARIDIDRFFSLYNLQQTALLTDRLDPQTLYVLDERELEVARLAIPGNHAALFRLDGLNVLAPGWGAALPAGAVDLRLEGPGSTSFALPFESDFTVRSTGRTLLGNGWSATDAATDATSLSDVADLFVPGGHDAGRSVHVELSLHRNSTGRSMARELVVWSGEQRIGTCQLVDDGCRHLVFDVPAATQGSYFRNVQLRADQPSAKLRITLDAMHVE